MTSTLRRLRRATTGRFVRYTTVSAISTLTSLSILGLLVGLCGFSPVWSNVIATAVGTVPSFELNRRWVWSHDGPRSLGRQALPYCSLAFVGLALSTLAVHLAGNATASSTRLVHTAAVVVANCGTYGVLWVGQFALCDRILFRPRAATANRTDRDADRLAGAAPAAVPSGSANGTGSSPSGVGSVHDMVSAG